MGSNNTPKRGLKRFIPLFLVAFLLLSGSVLAAALPNSRSSAAPRIKTGDTGQSTEPTAVSTSSNNTPTATPPDAGSSGPHTPSATLTSAPAAQGDKTHPAPAMNNPNTIQVNEQFSGSRLDPSLWQAMTRPQGYRNNEEQDYSPAQVSVSNGTLQITAARDAAGNWHSGEVDSKWGYTYGEFEVRLAVSATGPGIWPAAWLIGNTDTWPNGGELDMFENINGDSNVYATLHGGGNNGAWQLQKQVSGINVTQYHTYKLVKQPGYISWWIDGAKQAQWSPTQVPVGGVWPFESHANMGILNLAVGGTWPGPSTAATPGSVTMYVDYFTVRNAS